MKQSPSKEQNEYAKNVKEEPIYILEAESGRKGYWCMGCGEEMEAVRKIKNIHHKSYFRHCAKDVEIERKCTFSNQDYRHRLAIDILQRTKRIKVPNLYKYAPDDSQAILLEETKFIEAHSVRAELTFYENDEAGVHWGKNPEIDNKNLLIRPDVTFFDVHGKPILLIEIVVSHKLDDDKKAKIKRLGINTIQITIPKDSPENIAKNFQITKNTKWVFNHVEQNTNYFQLSNRTSERILPLDPIEMGFFRESFVCRENQIRNLIRGLRKCVESQYYRNTERKLESELSRVKENSERNRERLEQLRIKHRESVESRYRESYDILEREESEFEHSFYDAQKQLYEEYNREQTEIEQRYANLEGRYLAKIESINKEQAIVNREIKFRYRAGRTEEDIRREFESEETRIVDELNSTKREERYIEESIQSESGFEENFEGERLKLENEERELEQKFAELERHEQEEFDRLRKKFLSDEGATGEFTKFAVEERIRSDYEREYQQIIERVNNRDVQSGDELSEKIKTILELRGLFDNYDDVQTALERLRKGRTIIKNGSYKEWDK
ncbi:coiled-coil domain-containing protein [Flavobacterium undicola]|uniref:hypothetical protein n=1 Tax=Flavobacterium undicola TaxID=1932779 RepID=UPI001377183E|nr:hypothetical protein [Flavobacterium undicola]MBA0883040.1 hypothetical protein [Flavobacterium undicola]